MAVPKRVVIVGGVAGGMSTATRLRRLDESAEIIVLERSGHVSFANCGLPYFVGGVIEEEADLTLQTPRQLFDRFRLDVRVDSEVIAVDRDAHAVIVRSTATGEVLALGYDHLVLSTGAAPVRPPIPGYERARTLRTVEDAARLEADADEAPAHAVVIGAGFIGLEVTENLVARGIAVTLVEAAPQVLPPLDPELAILVADELVAHGVQVEVGTTVSEVGEREVLLADGRTLPADLVIGAIGVRPDAELARAAGLELGPNGGVAVDDANRTSDPDIYGSATSPRSSTRCPERRRSSRSRTSRTVRAAESRTTSPAGRRTPSRHSAPPSSRCSTSWPRPSVGTSGASTRSGAVTARSTRTRSTTRPTTRARPAWRPS
jgi:NADPH-dependent 2,4-dienoyl-CoA reductase/sulfur reductase-like enzyme